MSDEEGASLGAIDSVPERQRVFICLEIPHETQKSIAQLQARFPDLPSIRRNRTEQLHFTLRFLGDLSAEQVDAVVEAVGVAASRLRPFTATVSGLGAFPNLRRPRVLWVGATTGASEMIALERQVDAELERRGYPPAESAFAPHVTLARIRSRPERRDVERIQQVLETRRITEAYSFMVREITVMRSVRGRAGSTYEAIRRVPLQLGAAPTSSQPHE